MSEDLTLALSRERRTVASITRVEIVPRRATANKQTFEVWLGAELLVTCHDPEHAACRALLARGVTGRLVTRWRGSAHDAMRVDIEQGAARTITDTRRGLKSVPYRDDERHADDAA